MATRTTLLREQSPPGDPIRRARSVPGAPSRLISRAALVNRLRAARSSPVVSIVAPAGYGKTVLLAQWEARDERAFAYIALESRSDVQSLVARVSQALGESEPIEARKRGEAPLDWVWRTAVPRLAAALSAVEEPVVLVFDDAHRLDDEAVAVVTALIDCIPEGSTLALAGRSQPLPSLPRLRASGELLDLGADDVAFTRREARSLLHALLGTGVSEQQLDEVLTRTEGWAAGIRLVGLSQRAGRSRPGSSEANFSDYVETECLAALGPEQRTFLRRTSILGRLCGPLCDAVLERDDSVRMLAALEAAGFLVALDRGREWFRYHRAVQEQLRCELVGQDAWIVPELERRAAAWLEEDGDAERALRHWYAAGAVDEVARVIDSVAVELHNDGRDEALVGWLSLLEKGCRLEDHPKAAALAARLYAQCGRESEAERCLAAALRGARIRTPGRRDPVLVARIELVRAAMCADGVESMLIDAEHALDHLSADDDWRPYGLLLQGTAYALLGESERADPILSRAVHAAGRLGSNETCALASTQRALLAADEGDRVRAGQLLDGAVDRIHRSGLETYPTSALTFATAARFELLHGHSPEAFAILGSARALLPGLRGSMPWLAVQTRLELADADVTLRDAASGGRLLAEVDELLACCPELGVLRHRRRVLAAAIEAVPAGADGRSVGLTTAELRLVPMLATHLSFREIGARFFLSRNTVKTQAISVYRKLGASSRSEAVVRAHDLGLIEDGSDAEVLIRTG
jgi:LuxR family transcriptional regulator, maltose regulon positive regulatory protein